MSAEATYPGGRIGKNYTCSSTLICLAKSLAGFTFPMNAFIPLITRHNTNWDIHQLTSPRIAQEWGIRQLKSKDSTIWLQMWPKQAIHGWPKKLHTTDGRAAENQHNRAASVTSFIHITEGVLPDGSNYSFHTCSYFFSATISFLG